MYEDEHIQNITGLGNDSGVLVICVFKSRSHNTYKSSLPGSSKEKITSRK